MFFERRRSIAFASALFTACALLACALPGRGVARAATSTGDSVVIGVDLPLSGPDAVYGVSIRNGVALALADIDADPSLHGSLNFTMSALDDALGVKQGAANVQSFIGNAAVLGVVGPFDSNVASAQIKPSNDAGLVLISPAAADAGLTKRGSTSFFRVCATDASEAAIEAQYARRFLGATKAFIIDDGDAYGERVAAAFKKAFATSGAVALVVGSDRIAKGQQTSVPWSPTCKRHNPT
jgi:branched-chain amino acid transport system substrate-binding protein